MSVAYVDASALLAVAFGEPTRGAVERRLAQFTSVTSSNLLEAELRAGLSREGRVFDPRLTRGITWVLPDRPLTPELVTVLGAGYLRGADLWHVAAALYAAPDPQVVTFVTLDRRQAEGAAALGFQT
ncbi:MAG: type II toxin-antitoxin system VapC family toxin [Chloroflexi bacterium]|nr:type II toxin-antitoxin system VapC family toxin [Chloroflexota bacterium]